MDLAALAADYDAAQARAALAHRQYQQARREVSTAGDALIAAMMDAGVTEYGPITSKFVSAGGELRRVWLEREPS